MGVDAEAVLADLGVLAEDFGRLFRTDCVAHCRTVRRVWPSLIEDPKERFWPVVGKPRGDWSEVLAGAGIEFSPLTVSSADAAESARVFFDAIGRPMVNSVGRSMIEAPGWRDDVMIGLAGPGSVRASETIERANSLVADACGLIWPHVSPGRAATVGAFCWPSVVDLVAERAGRSTLKPAAWFVPAGRESFSLEVWRRRSDFELGGPSVDPELAERIGDAPETLYADRPGFLRDCESAARWLIDRIEAGLGDRPGGEAKSERDGLSDDGRTLHWGGGVYPIGSMAVGVIQLLVDSYHAGKPYLSQAFLMAEGECKTELRTLVKNNGLEGVLVRQEKSDGSVVKGMWGLADPRKIEKKTNTR